MMAAKEEFVEAGVIQKINKVLLKDIEKGFEYFYVEAATHLCGPKRNLNL